MQVFFSTPNPSRLRTVTEEESDWEARSTIRLVTHSGPKRQWLDPSDALSNFLFPLCASNHRGSLGSPQWLDSRKRATPKTQKGQNQINISRLPARIGPFAALFNHFCPSSYGAKVQIRRAGSQSRLGERVKLLRSIIHAPTSLSLLFFGPSRSLWSSRAPHSFWHCPIPLSKLRSPPTGAPPRL